jgi:choline-sulfatase
MKQPRGLMREAGRQVRGAERPPGGTPCLARGARRRVIGAWCLAIVSAACAPAPRGARAQNLVLITIDTLRADHVGAYGHARARTPAIDALARSGVRFEHAYAAAPITLPSHATILSGRYPPGHGARDNGMHMSPAVPTLATELHARGFRTAAFVGAFPLDHQFGLGRGFDVYSDRMPRGPDGRLADERPGSQVVDEAIRWLRTAGPTGTGAFFLWVHLFEPHAPYGNPAAGRPAIDRYDEEIATADREVGRLIAALGTGGAGSVIVVAGDHGEAFGEHGEYAHSIFAYDTTLRVPLVIVAPAGAAAGGAVSRGAQVVSDPVTLADVAPTVIKLLGGEMKDVDGIDLGPAVAGKPLAARELYAESFAPLVEFGWAPLRAIRSGPWKYVAAPRPELYDVANDPAEQADLRAAQPAVARALDQRASRYSGAGLPGEGGGPDPQAAERLRALGYSPGSRAYDSPGGGGRPDPKDRRDVAAHIAQVTSGELSGAALISALEGIVKDDPRNAQAHLRLGYARLQAGDCVRAEPEFHAAAQLPSADPFLGLAACLGQRRDLAGAERALGEARRLEPSNPVVLANIGILQAAKGDVVAAIDALKAALTADPDLHEARFNLTLAYARAGRRADAIAAARDLLARLPPDAPQRTAISKLIKSLQ